MIRAQNVYSNGVYVLAGLMGWYLGGFSPFVFACIFLGIGSALYHQFYSDEGLLGWTSHQLDEVGMYMVFSSIFLLLMGSFEWGIYLTFWMILVAISLVSNAVTVLGVLSVLIVGNMFLKGLILESIACLTLFGVAYYLQRSDKGHHHERFGINHVLWHILTGLMITLLYYFVTKH